MAAGRPLRLLFIGAVLAGAVYYLPPLVLWIHSTQVPKPAAVVTNVLPAEPGQRGKVINVGGEPAMLGKQLAATRNVRSHLQCRDQFESEQRAACHDYVTSRKKFPPHVRQGNWDSGKSSDLCRAEVDAYWAAVTQDLTERGDTRAAQARRQREWIPERRACDNYDNVRIGRTIDEPNARLNTLLNRLEAGAEVGADDVARVRQDMARVAGFPDHPSRSEYLRNAERFFARVQ